MKIAVNSGNYKILNSIIRGAKKDNHTISIVKFEKTLLDTIDNEKADAYIINGDLEYAPKVIEFIKKYYNYIPVIVISRLEKYEKSSADMIIPYTKETDTDYLASVMLHNVYMYHNNFEILARLTAKMGDIIEFGDCTYDPTKRLISKNGILIKQLSPKQASVFELLAANFSTVVKKDIILEKVWQTSNYFVSRSLDVFVTHLRKILKEGELNMNITNMANIGLILDFIPKTKI